ncbi:MAG: type II toxin-antitoxin system VapC family toxin [Candidatus Micrarchaeota archaeon]
MTEYLADTSALIDYLQGKLPEAVMTRLDETSASISILSVYELNKYFRNTGKISEWWKIISDIKKYNILALNFETCELAGELSNTKSLSAIDSLIYATALTHNYTFLTRDSDFAKMKKVEII